MNYYIVYYMTNPLCKYKDILGVAGEGSGFRLFGIRVIDVTLLIVGAFIIAKIFKWSYWYTLIGLFILGIIAHRLFCVRTQIDKLLFTE